MPILTSEEFEVLQDQHFLLVKNVVSDKITHELSKVERLIRDEIDATDFPFPEKAFLKSGKISRGDQYLGLPYFVLDYPRLFSKQDVFSFRTILWWGNEISCTLHLEGYSLELFREKIVSRIPGQVDLFLCINSSPWHYHFEASNYLPTTEITEKIILDQIADEKFLKIGRKLELNKIDHLNSFVLETFTRFLKYLY